MTDEIEERFTAIEAKVEGLYRLMDQATDVLENIQSRLDDEHGRAGAALIVTTALVQALGRIAPEVLAGLVQHLERVERELASETENAATVRELAECRAVLKALHLAGTAGS